MLSVGKPHGSQTKLLECSISHALSCNASARMIFSRFSHSRKWKISRAKYRSEADRARSHILGVTGKLIRYCQQQIVGKENNRDASCVHVGTSGRSSIQVVGLQCLLETGKTDMPFAYIQPKLLVGLRTKMLSCSPISM